MRIKVLKAQFKEAMGMDEEGLVWGGYRWMGEDDPVLAVSRRQVVWDRLDGRFPLAATTTNMRTRVLKVQFAELMGYKEGLVWSGDKWIAAGVVKKSRLSEAEAEGEEEAKGLDRLSLAKAKLKAAKAKAAKAMKDDEKAEAERGEEADKSPKLGDLVETDLDETVEEAEAENVYPRCIRPRTQGV